uniref:Uncharacterized protein n=1 Tax=Arundo donax TaxID=35708 RepID=A0A0A9DAR1_ARUDO
MGFCFDVVCGAYLRNCFVPDIQISEVRIVAANSLAHCSDRTHICNEKR